MALSPKQRNWCEDLNISSRLVETISSVLTTGDEMLCSTCGVTPCRCQLDEFPFGLESAETPEVTEQLSLPSGIPIPTDTLAVDAKKERKLRDKAEQAVSDDVRLRMNRKADKVVMHPDTNAPN